MKYLDNPLGICAWFVPGSSLRDKVQFVHDCGLQGMELDFNHADGYYMLAEHKVQQELQGLAEQYDIAYPALGVNSLCEFGMSNASHKTRVRSDILAAINTAKALDIPIVQLPSFFAGDITTTEEFECTVGNIQYACDQAGPFNILIGSENALPGPQQLELVKRVKRENFKIYYDSRNSFWMKGIESAPILREVLPYICEVHLKDGVDQQEACLPLGQGNSGIPEIISILREARYSKWILLENNYNQPSELSAKQRVQADMRYIRDMMSIN